MLNNVIADQSAPQIISSAVPASSGCKVAVLWIDWYAYHVARFQGLVDHPELSGQVVGIEMVGGVGVHAGLRFRQEIPSSLPVQTLLAGSGWKEAGKWSLARLIWRCLNELNPSVVLVPGYYTVPALAAAIWARLKGKKPVLMTESTEHDHARAWWRESVKALLIRSLFDWAVAGGAPHRRYLQQLKFPSGRVAGFYDVVNNRFFQESCRHLRSTHRPADFQLPDHYFLYVGRIAPEKSTDLLLTEYIQYRVSGGTASLVLVGDGPQMKAIRDLASKIIYASDIYFPGLKNTSELPVYYAFAAAFVIASTREPWGLVVNEAMACGLPVIVSSRCGCVEDLVRHTENGFIFDPSEAGSLAESLTRFSSLSTEKREAMGKRSCELISAFSPGAWAEEINRIVKA